MSLKRIPRDVEKRISASIDTKSFTRVVEELVYNAFDAKATSIAVRVFIEEGSIQVIDNGYGISKKDFAFVGRRYYTSKYGGDLPAEYYGYRGLSLASLVEVSRKVKISSRYHNNKEYNTFIKTFIEGKEMDITEMSTRPSKGTTVNVSGFLYNFHIQKKSINATTEMSHIKTFLERISLVHCNTSMSLRDESVNEIIFQINKHRDVTQTLQTLYQIRPQEIQELQVEKNEYKIHGFIEKGSNGDKNYRHAYINGRFIKNSKLQSTIDRRLKSKNYNKVTINKQILDDTEKVSKENLPFYFIFINCPQKDCHIKQNNEESLVEFKNWDKIDILVEKLIKFYRGDLKIKKIKNICQKSTNKMNEDTRKKVRQIMHKILNTNTKSPKRLRLRTGVIGKHALRKDNRKADKLSITKILSKQFKSRYKEFYKSHPPKYINNSLGNRFLSNENNGETHIKISYKGTGEAKDSNEVSLKQNKINTQNWEVQPNHARISQDPLSKKFKNPSDTILKRCNTLLKDLKEYFDPYKGIDHFEHTANKTVRTQIDVTFKNCDVTHKQALIKTSDDLIKTIFNWNEVFKLNYLGPAKDDKQETVKNYIDKNYRIKNYCYQKVNFDSVAYLKESPPNKRKRLFTKTSSDNFQKIKMLSTILPINEKTRNNIGKNNYKHEFKLKTNMYTEKSIQTMKTFESHFGKNFECVEDEKYVSHRGHKFEIYSSKVQTYNSKKILRSNNENVTKRNDFHKTLTKESKNCCSQVKKVQYTKDNKTFFDKISDKIYYKSDDMFLNTDPLIVCEIVYHNEAENNDFRKDLYDILSIKSNKNYTLNYYKDNDEHNQILHQIRQGTQSAYSDHLNHTDIKNCIKINKKSKVNVGEGLLYDTIANHSDFRDDFQDNVSIRSKENTLINSSKDYGIFNHFLKEENKSLRLDHLKVTNYDTEMMKNTKNPSQVHLETVNPLCLRSENIDCDSSYSKNKINENTETSEQKKCIAERSPSRVNINWDYLINGEDFKLNSRHNFIPKGMSQIIGIQYPKVLQLKEVEPELNYYNTDIYDNFATNLQNFSKVLEPGVQVLSDLSIEGIRYITEPCNNGPIFDEESLKTAKVIGQVDNKFIGAKVTGRHGILTITSDFFVLFDQHAVDERIRLENNLADYFDGDAWNSVSIDIVPIKLSKDILRYLHNYKEKFARFGLQWACNDDVVFIKGIPKAILGKHCRQIDVIIKAVKSLISEEVEAIKSLKGNISLHPKSIMDLVFSEACRYAVKFGDVLGTTECEKLLRALSTCKLPFQCAHGRPVMAVMMELPMTTNEYKINMENLKEIKQKLASYPK